jgi:16S rRNA (uracil1498-N3)-methyltransferase
MTPPLFLVDGGALVEGTVVVGGDEARHAVDVRRLRAGEQVLLGDGAGRLGEGVVTAASRGELVVDVAVVRAEAQPQPRLVVAQALAKGGRDEDAVETMTEVGVDVILGWQAMRSVAKWTDRTDARWAATVRAAAKQSRRAWVPSVEGPLSTEQLARRVPSCALAVVLDADAAAPLAALTLPEAGDVLVVVGPEGGIGVDELALLTAAGAGACRLGPHVLRTSTAGVAAISVLSAQRRWR